MRRAWGAALAGLLLAVTGCAGAEEPGTFAGTRLGDPFDVPAVPLTDTGGSSYSLVEDTDDPLTLLFFGYTHCPDICTMVMSNVASALTRLDEEDRERVEVVFVTTDPARDDPEELREYLDRFDEDFEGLTGDLDDIVAIAEDLGVLIEEGEKLPTGGYDVAHTDHLFVIDGTDEVPVIWRRETSSAALAADLATMLEDA